MLGAGESADTWEILGPDDLDGAETMTAALPTGGLQVSWASASDQSEPPRDSESRELASAQGADLLVVAWAPDASVRDFVQGSLGFATMQVPEVEIALVRGDTRVPLASGEGSSVLRGSSYASFPDSGDWSVEVVFDGLTQRLNAGGAEAPDSWSAFERGYPAAEASFACEPRKLEPICRYQAGWLPWVSSQGWAPEGQAWPVLRVEATTPGGDGSVTYDATLDGASPVWNYTVGDDQRLNEVLVFPAQDLGAASFELAAAQGRVEVSGTALLEPSTRP